ncbi:unnamed protein product [Rotaria socialis]|uniref:Glycosyl hydrolase-like 10 domain-containing protein n=1 Tax=Rotaria socialis TaxID=392032 RepID=A0A818BIB4_9BILA|nr:unnamed protein product [Rotaria socialis]
MKDYSTALSYYKRALETRQQSLPSNHPQLIKTYHDMATTYKSLCRYSDALSCLHKALEIQEETLSTDHRDLTTTWHDLGLVYFEVMDYSNAVTYVQKSVDVRERLLSSTDFQLGTVFSDIGLVYKTIGDYTKASSYYEKALRILKIHLPDTDHTITIIHNNIAGLYLTLGSYSTALLYYKNVLEIREQSLPPNDLDLATTNNNIADTHGNLAQVLFLLHQYEEATEHAKQAVNIAIDAFENDHPTSVMFANLFQQLRANTCDTYNHPQYGFGQGINQSLCPNDLYLTGLCESKPMDVKCCFSSQTIKEEFRAAWIATVSNIDWLSTRTATPTQQQSELLNILNTLQKLNMNAVVFQIRPVGDKLYASSLKPWSIYLTGIHGKPPSPLWDPLEFIIAEAHKRNIEVHAWINPYRARMSGATYELASNHMAKRFSKYAYTYNKYMWMDPGSVEVQEFIVNVTEDIVRQYAVDGIHMDDYFYPYNDGTEFPDGTTYAEYQQHDGK